MDNVTALIKTFLRDEELFLCVESLRKSFPALRIMVADDGYPSYVKEAFLKGHGVEYHLLPFNQGCPNGKNFLVDRCTTPYCLLGDDDFYYTPDANLADLIKLMNIADLAGGAVIEGGEVKHFEGFAHQENDTLYLEHLKFDDPKKYDGVLYKDAGFVFNFFVARVDALRHTRWDPNLMIRFEHEDFFLRFINDGHNAVYAPNSKVYHKYRPPEPARTSRYDDFRHYNRKDKVYFFNKWKITTFRRYEGAVETISSAPAPTNEIVPVDGDPLLCPLPPIAPPDTVISCRQAAVHDGIAYWSRVYDKGNVILKQGTRDLAEREAVFLRQLEGKHFPRVLDVGSTGSYSVIALEKLSGLRPEKCDPQINSDITLLRTFLLGCIDLLRALKTRGITHRQIRREHLLVSDGKPLLLDFACACSTTDPGFAPSGLERPPDGNFCDVYSMGKVLEEVSDRRRPAVDAVIKLMTDEYPALRISDLDVLEVLFGCACGSGGHNVKPDVQLHELAVREVLARAFRARPPQLGFIDCEAQRVEKAAAEIAELVPWNTSIILVDCAKTDIHRWLEGRPCVPMMEQGGRYWGAPSDDASAIRELERQRKAGAGFAVFAWPALWWLDYYGEMTRYLRQNFQCLLTNERLVVFDIRQPASALRKVQECASD